jgi:CDP-4-dehydro-6-deoxyglucose reductase, E1
MLLEKFLNKVFDKKTTKRTHHIFPLKDSTFRNKDLIEGIKVILSRNMTMSKTTSKFEKIFSKRMKTKNSSMVNSGSSANFLAFQCLINPSRKNKLKKNDEVLVPAVCWPTSLWPIIQSGLKPVFVDVDKETFNMSLDDLEKKITKKTRALILIHVLGNSTNMDKLMRIINKKKIILIEDTCESIGAKYKNKFLGTFGQFSTFSFYYSHQISSVEGGMISCKSKADDDIIKSLRSHGWARDLSNQKQIEKKYKKINKKFLFINSGFNFRATDIQSAIGLSQFKSLNSFIKIRSINRNKIIKKLSSDNRWKDQVHFVETRKNLRPSWFGISMLLNQKYKNKKDQVLKKLDNLGIESRPIIGGNFLKQPALDGYNIKQKSIDFPNANYVHEYGFFVGLKNKVLSNVEVNKFANIFFNSFKGL